VRPAGPPPTIATSNMNEVLDRIKYFSTEFFGFNFKMRSNF